MTPDEARVTATEMIHQLLAPGSVAHADDVMVLTDTLMHTRKPFLGNVLAAYVLNTQHGITVHPLRDVLEDIQNTNISLQTNLTIRRHGSEALVLEREVSFVPRRYWAKSNEFR